MVLVNFGRKNLFWSNLVPAGFEPGTFGVTATDVTVLTNGLRLQVCVLFLQVKWSLRDSNLGPSGIEPRTFGVTATNVTVSNNGPRSQVKPGHSGPLFFSIQHFFSPTDKKKFSTFFSLPIGPRGFFPASAVFRCCIPGNSGHSGHVRFWQGKFSNRQFFFNRQVFFQPTFCFSNRQKAFFSK